MFQNSIDVLNSLIDALCDGIVVSCTYSQMTLRFHCDVGNFADSYTRDERPRVGGHGRYFQNVSFH